MPQNVSTVGGGRSMAIGAVLVAVGTLPNRRRWRQRVEGGVKKLPSPLALEVVIFSSRGSDEPSVVAVSASALTPGCPHEECDA